MGVHRLTVMLRSVIGSRKWGLVLGLLAAAVSAWLFLGRTQSNWLPWPSEDQPLQQGFRLVSEQSLENMICLPPEGDMEVAWGGVDGSQSDVSSATKWN